MNFQLNKNYFLFFVLIAFVFLSTTAISLSVNDYSKFNIKDTQSNLAAAIFEKEFPSNPTLKAGANFPTLSAQGVLAVDLNSGVTLYEKNPDEKLLPASTTKIVTALVALDSYKLDDILTVPSGVSVDGQKMGLYVGEKMKVEDLLYGLLVYSANDAAMTLAINYPGGYDAFINQMNIKALELNMTNSHFENPVGLDGNTQTTTAKDMVRASEIAMRIPDFSKIVGTKSITFTDVAGKTKYSLNNINQLIGKIPGVSGIKTGWTENARENLITYVDRDGHGVILAVLGSQDRFGETKELIDWIFQNYDWQEVKVPIAIDNSRM